MRETARQKNFAPPSTAERELAPNVWLRQTEDEGQFVEIVMPPFELNDLIEECDHYFPAYAIQVLERLARARPETLAVPLRISPEVTQGLKNTHVLGNVLARHNICGDRALKRMPELQQAFGLAMKGRLKLTADPISDL